VKASFYSPAAGRKAQDRAVPAISPAKPPFISFRVESEKQLGNRETILPPARKNAEALEL
jgi:hypothetical protein